MRRRSFLFRSASPLPLIPSEKEPSAISLHYEIPKEGKYYMVLAMCDATTSNVNITGETLVMNPYGHVPARLYGLIPFTNWLLVAYSVLLVAWAARCMKFSKELMSVHKMISLALSIFWVDTLIRLINIKSYNIHGTYITSITIISLIISAVTRAVARYLTIMVAMGSGVSRASLGKATWRILAVCAVYFGFTLWDSIATTFSTSTAINYYRVIPASIVDSVIYFWILQALLETIQELEDKKQSSKLEVFSHLRNMIIVIVIVSTLYNVVLSYLISHDYLEKYWKYQWFFNDGVWSSFYFLILCSIAVGECWLCDV